MKAQLLVRQQHPEEAEALLNTAVPTDLPHELGGQAYLVHAQVLCKLNRTADAQRVLDPLAQRITNDEPRLRAELQLTLGMCVLPRDHSLALHYFDESARSAHRVNAYTEARALGAAGYVLMQDGRYDQAIEKLSAANSLTDSAWLRESLLGDLGECYQQLGDWKTATTYTEEAVKLSSEIKDAKEDRARWLIDLGREHYSQMNYAQGEEAWRTAFGIAAKANDAELKSRCLNNLAMLALTREDRHNAERYIREADALNLQGEQRSYHLLYKAKLAALEGDSRSSEELSRQVLAANPNPQVKYETETNLATLFVVQARFSEAEQMFRAGITTAETAFSQVGTDRSRISFQDYIPFYDQYVHFLVSQNRPLDALSVAERGRSRALAHGLRISDRDLKLSGDIRQIQRTLKTSGQVALAYWLGWKTESYLWAITPSTIKLFKLPPEKDIVDAIDAYTEEVLDMSTPEEAGMGQKLYEVLVAPAEKYIPKGSRVIIVPHRRLYKLNFETLVSPRPKPHFWIEDVCIQNASFLAVLEHPRNNEPMYPKDLLLMGAPVQASKDFPGLAHAPEEIEKISAHFPRSKETVLEGEQATPDAYQSSDPGQFRFFHFVTHGTPSDSNPLDSAIILSPSDDGYKLYARDIIKTRIHPELVTISACYGAGTRQYSGEGLVGLAWAFIRVGAHRVVAALWETDDAANADLMDHFYTELTNGKTAAVALRNGKLAMLRSNTPRKRPYYWAPLQLYTGP